MTRLVLTIDRQSPDLWVASNREILLQADESIESLEWTMRIAEGGYWSGRARLKLNAEGPAYAKLVTEGLSGVARIYWIRDETDASAVDDETDLLWMGIAEDAQTQLNSNTVELSLRGIGQFLRNIPITRSFTGAKIVDAVQAVFNDVIAATGSPLTAHDVDATGACQRRISIDFDATPADRVLRELAQQLGGPARIAWGVRTSDDSDDFGIGYFKLWEGHHYEKEIGDQTIVDDIPLPSILAKKIVSVSSDIRNSVQVIGKEIEQTGTSEEKIFVEATVQAVDSVRRHGKRHETVFDTSLETPGQCALVAAGKVMERGTRSIDADVDFVLPMENKDRGSGKAWNVLTRSLKFPARIIPIRDRDVDYITWGDSRNIYETQRNTSTHSYAKIDLTDAPQAVADAPLLDLSSAIASGSERFYFALQERSAMVAPAQGVSIFELDRALALVWVAAGANWKLAILYCDALGAWQLAAISSITRTTAELANTHHVALKYSYLSGTQFRCWAYHRDLSNGSVVMVPATTLNYSQINPATTVDRIYLNAVASSGVDSFPGATKGDSGDCKTAYFGVTNGEIGTPEAFLAELSSKSYPFKYYEHLNLLTNFGNTKNGKGASRYSYSQTAALSEFNFEPKGNLANSFIVEDPTTFSSFRSYSWRLGNDAFSRKYGGHFELLPFRAKMKYAGPGSPLRIRISGESGARTATGFIETLTDAIQKANEASRNA